LQDALVIRRAQTQVVAIRLLNANSRAEVAGDTRLPAVSNYLVGGDQSRWCLGVPSFERVRYREIYPGIDLVLYGNSDNSLEFDFVLRPGSDPGSIRLSFDGSSNLGIEPSGDLLTKTPYGVVHLRSPVAYQDSQGSRRPVTSRYVLNGQEVQVAVASYARDRPLVIDPVVAYASYLGGNGLDEAVGVGTDASGCVYVAGTTESVDFPVTPGTPQGQLDGVQSDLFISKFEPGGARLLFSTYLGGSAIDTAAGIAVASDGGVYVTGGTQSGDLPATPDAFQGTPGGLVDGFVAELDPGGSRLVYLSYLGGPGFDEGRGITVNSAGRLLITGVADTGFPTTPGAFQTVGDGSDAFIVAMNIDATIDYSTYLGGSGVDEGYAIAIDHDGKAFLTGQTTSEDFPSTSTAFQHSPGGGFDAFIASLSTEGTTLLYASYLGGPRTDVARAIALDTEGNVYLAGQAAAEFPTTEGAPQRDVAGFVDAFVAKVQLATGALEYSTYLGGSGDVRFGCPDLCIIEGAYALAVDEEGNAYVAGQTVSRDFPIVNASNVPSKRPSHGASAGFYSKIDAFGRRVLVSLFIGGRADDVARAITRDSTGNVYLVGGSLSTDFPVTPRAFQVTARAGAAFVMKLGVPSILNVSVKKRNLIVSGEYFDSGAVIVVDDMEQRTSNKQSAPTSVLIGKHVVDGIPQGTTVTLRIRNSDGTVSTAFHFTRPRSIP